MNLFSRLIAILLAALTFPLRLLGLGPGPGSAQALAVEAFADDGPAPVDDALAYPLGALIREHAARRRSPLDPGAPALTALPDIVEAWMARLSRDQLFAVRRTPPRLLEQHALGGEEGKCRFELGIVTPAAVFNIPIQTRAEQSGSVGGSSSGGQRPAKERPLIDEDDLELRADADEIIASLQRR